MLNISINFFFYYFLVAVNNLVFPSGAPQLQGKYSYY